MDSHYFLIEGEPVLSMVKNHIADRIACQTRNSALLSDLGVERYWPSMLDGTVAGVMSDSCPLCRLFMDDFCSGCPVAKATDRLGCNGTPWIQAYSARKAGDLDAFHTAAREEVAFLKSLLPEGA